MVKVGHNGAWYPLIGKKIYGGETWITLKYRDRIRYGGQWYPLGSIDEAEFEIGTRHRTRLQLREIHADGGELDEHVRQRTWTVVQTHHHR